jgi:hypothetical protein
MTNNFDDDFLEYKDSEKPNNNLCKLDIDKIEQSEKFQEICQKVCFQEFEKYTKCKNIKNKNKTQQDLCDSDKYFLLRCLNKKGNMSI